MYFFEILHVAVYLGFASSPKKLVPVLLIPTAPALEPKPPSPKSLRRVEESQAHEPLGDRSE
jgi:hypothetical protein